jgi:hypothetical protein
MSQVNLVTIALRCLPVFGHEVDLRSRLAKKDAWQANSVEQFREIPKCAAPD